MGPKAGIDSVGEGDTDADGHVPPAWSTLHSVLLGTWERRPLMTSPKDRNKMLDNAAAFVRACFPGQVSRKLVMPMNSQCALKLGVYLTLSKIMRCIM